MESLDIIVDITSERTEPELSPLRSMLPGSQLAIRFWIARRVLHYFWDQYNVRKGKELRLIRYLRSLKNVMVGCNILSLTYVRGHWTKKPTEGNQRYRSRIRATTFITIEYEPIWNPGGSWDSLDTLMSVAEWLFSESEGTRHVYETLSGPGFFVECMFEVPEGTSLWFDLIQLTFPLGTEHGGHPVDVEYASSASDFDEVDDVLLLHWRMRVSHPLGIFSQVTEFGRWVKKKSRNWWKVNMRFYE